MPQTNVELSCKHMVIVPSSARLSISTITRVTQHQLFIYLLSTISSHSVTLSPGHLVHIPIVNWRYFIHFYGSAQLHLLSVSTHYSVVALLLLLPHSMSLVQTVSHSTVHKLHVIHLTSLAAHKKREYSRVRVKRKRICSIHYDVH